MNNDLRHVQKVYNVKSLFNIEGGKRCVLKAQKRTAFNLFFVFSAFGRMKLVTLH